MVGIHLRIELLAGWASANPAEALAIKQISVLTRRWRPGNWGEASRNLPLLP